MRSFSAALQFLLLAVTAANAAPPAGLPPAYQGMGAHEALAPKLIRDLKVCDERSCIATPLADIDPQGRRVLVRAVIVKPTDMERMTLRLSAVASSEVYLNGVLVGRNGRPGTSADTERPGFYAAMFDLPAPLWRPGDNNLDIRMSGFRGLFKLGWPVNLSIDDPTGPDHRPHEIAVYVCCGALLAGMIYFGALYAARRARSSALLALLAAAALLRAGVETFWPNLFPYLYPTHHWRLLANLALAWLFGVLLAALMAEQFLPARRNLVIAIAGALGFAASWVGLGFDAKTAIVLLIGALAAAFAAWSGLRQHIEGAKRALAYLSIFLAALFTAPTFFLDVSFFLVAALLLLALMIAEVARLWKDDRQRADIVSRAVSGPNRLTVATAKGVELVDFDQIVAIRGADDYAELHLLGERTLLHAATLDHLQTNLPDYFCRVHRSAIANLRHAVRFHQAQRRFSLEMTEGETLPVSRTRSAAVRARVSSIGALGAELRSPAPP